MFTIKFNKKNSSSPHHFSIPFFLNAISICFFTASIGTKAVSLLATKTKLYPCLILSSESLYASLITRFARFRFTALPVFLLTVIPRVLKSLLFRLKYKIKRGYISFSLSNKAAGKSCFPSMITFFSFFRFENKRTDGLYACRLQENFHRFIFFDQ